MREAQEDSKEVLTLSLPVPGDRELGHCYELNLGMLSCSNGFQEQGSLWSLPGLGNSQGCSLIHLSWQEPRVRYTEAGNFTTL